MTEAQWMAADDPESMLAWLGQSGCTSRRRLRLLFAVCCRHIRDRAPEATTWTSDDKAEDNREGATQQGSSHAVTAGAAPTADADDSYEPVAQTDLLAPPFDFLVAAEALRAVGKGHRERAVQVALLRDIFGNPFRRLAIGPSRLTADVTALARAIDDQGSFDRLPELADLLEATGCSDAELLGHLRGPGPHVRGCHALDAVLCQQ
jgi:hypothetical protein